MMAGTTPPNQISPLEIAIEEHDAGTICPRAALIMLVPEPFRPQDFDFPLRVRMLPSMKSRSLFDPL